MRGLGYGAAVAVALTATAGRAQAADPPLFSDARTSLLMDDGGVRSFLDSLGITVSLNETSEVLGNLTGGTHRGADYDGLTTASATLDTSRRLGWQGGTFWISALQSHGRDLSADNLQSLQTASGIEASRATRLWEAWFQQSALDGHFDVKIGQQSIDQEFMSSANSALFVNTMMGWPLVPSADLYASGPSYPLSSLGVRLRGQAAGVTVLGGVFDDNPPGGPFGDDGQLRGAEKSGLAFNTNNGALAIAEVQYARPAHGWAPAGTYKIGGWYDSGAFPDAGGGGATRRGNFSVYALADQTLWQADPKGGPALSAFARVMGAPDDRNLISFSANFGLTLKAPFAGRSNDSAGVGGGYGRVTAAGRSGETFVEITYQCQIAPWWAVQPDAQYVFMPGGGIADPSAPGQRIGNEAVIGVRTSVVF